MKKILISSLFIHISEIKMDGKGRLVSLVKLCKEGSISDILELKEALIQERLTLNLL